MHKCKLIIRFAFGFRIQDDADLGCEPNRLRRAAFTSAYDYVSELEQSGQ
jgi:hypothetical protein